MKLETELNFKISAITTEIEQNHPELSKFLNEMPTTIPNDSSSKTDVKILNEYYESLKNILGEYEIAILGKHCRPDDIN